MRQLLLAAAIAAASAGCAERVTPGTAAPAPGASARMTEGDYERLMERIGPGYQALRSHLQGGSTDEAATDARRLAELFGGVEKFWAEHDRADAVKWAAAARTNASNAAGAAAAGDAANASAAAEAMGGACKGCHGTYRESDGQGGYRIKPGVLAPR
jgi:hypothetical protein